MFFYQGFSCPVCDQPFSENDDVVVCPACGAPHHRSCWKQEGHCHFEQTHGTSQQWTREQYTTHAKAAERSVTQRCPHCGHDNSVFAEFCAHCGKALQAEDWNSTFEDEKTHEQAPFSSFGGYGEYRPFHTDTVNVPDYTDIDGVSAKDFRLFVGQNSQYYVPRFYKMSQKGSSFGWNWAAFLMTPYWLWFRKQRFFGTIVLLFEVLRAVISSFVLYGYIGFSATMSGEELVMRLEQLSGDSVFRQWQLIIYLLLFISALLRVFFGVFGNYLYFSLAKKRILKLRGQANSAAIVAAGGVSSVLAIVAYVVLYLASFFSNIVFF